MNTPQLHGRILAGIVLILLGAFFFLQNNNIVYIPDEFYSWEYFMIAIGLLFLAFARNKTAGFVLVAIGLFNLYSELWPLVFVMIGAYIIWGHKRRFSETVNEAISVEDREGNFIEQINIFGGGKKFINSENFKGGSIISIFGGSEVSFINCKLADGTNSLEVVSIFGGSTLIVPNDWNVEVDVMPLFGGFSDKRRKDPQLKYPEEKKLIIKGIAIFGGGEVKTVF